MHNFFLFFLILVVKMSFNALPYEIILVIFGKISFDDLRNASLVCKKWFEIIENEEFWKNKIKNELNIKLKWDLDVKSLKSIYSKKLIGRNLIKNSSGENQFDFWQISNEQIKKDYNIVGNFSRTEGFIIENFDECSVPAYNENNEPIKKFATSYFSIYKYQIIDLVSEGLSSVLIDKLKPNLSIKDFYAARLYLGYEYYIKIVLFDDAFNVIDSTEFNSYVYEEDWSNGDWKEFSYLFRNLTKNLRYVLFFHGGKDTVYWHGHYGVKLTNSQVRILVE